MTVAELRACAESSILRAIVYRAESAHAAAELLVLAQALTALAVPTTVQHAEAILALRAARQYLATIHGTPVNDGRADGGVTRIDCAPTLAIVNGALDNIK